MADEPQPIPPSEAPPSVKPSGAATSSPPGASASEGPKPEPSTSVPTVPSNITGAFDTSPTDFDPPKELLDLELDESGQRRVEVERAIEETFGRKANPFLPKSVPKAYREQWRVAYLVERNLQPIIRKREVKDKLYLFHKVPSFAQVFNRMIEMVVGKTTERIDELQSKVEEVQGKAALFGWELVDAAIKANLVEFLTHDNDNLRADMTKKALDMLIKLAGAENRKELSEALFKTRGKKLDVVAKLQAAKEAAQKDQKLLGEGAEVSH